jgi:hypothetical protein
MAFNLSCDQITRDNASRLAVNQNDIQHLGAVIHRYFSIRDLTVQRAVSSQQQLLACLSAGIKSARHLRAAKRAVGQ